MKKISMKKLSLGIIVCVALVGCDKIANKVANKVTQSSSVTGNAFKFTLADGPAACLKAYKEKIGQDFKILEFSTWYALPETIDSKDISHYKGSKGGEMYSCDIQIQDPANEKKAVGYDMNMQTGEIEGPIPVEISVSGDAASFKLSDVVYPAGNIDFAAIQGNIDAIKPKLDAKYSVYQVSGIRMDSDLRTGKPHFLVHINGKLKANDIKESILMTLSPDGKKVLSNDLK